MNTSFWSNGVRKLGDVVRDENVHMLLQNMHGKGWVCNIGCGVDHIIGPSLAHSGCIVHGYDKDEARIRAAEQNNARYKWKLWYRVGRWLHIEPYNFGRDLGSILRFLDDPPPWNLYDGIMMNSVAQHMNPVDLWANLRMAKSMLRRDGVLLLSAFPHPEVFNIVREGDAEWIQYPDGAAYANYELPTCEHARILIHQDRCTPWSDPLPVPLTQRYRDASGGTDETKVHVYDPSFIKKLLSSGCGFLKIQEHHVTLSRTMLSEAGFGVTAENGLGSLAYTRFVAVN